MDDVAMKAGHLMTAEDAQQYERNQSRNAVNRWLHGFRFKNLIEVLSAISTPDPIRVAELGCAHGKLFELLNSRFAVEYTGVDIDPTLTAIANDRYGSRPNFRAVTGSAADVLPSISADVVIALETMEHIKESDVVRIVEAVAAMRPKLFVCSVPVEVGPAIWLKNVGSALTGYSRHREYTWRETFWAGLYKLDRVHWHGGGHCGFDWRWLAQTIRHNMRIRELRKFPFRWMPAALSTSVFMVCEPR